MTASFSDFLLPEPLMRGLARADYREPTPVQAQVIPLAIDGADLLVSAATGSGKTAAFLLPTMQRFIDVPKARGGTRALVLVPTRELARQIHDHFMQIGSYTRLTAEVVTGGEPRAHQVAKLRRNPEILIATPGRLLDLLQSQHVELGDLEILVLDEADRMLDMGFAEDVLTIIQQSPPERQSMLFSATLQQRGLARITESLLREPETLVINPVREQHPDISHQMLLSDDLAHKQQQLLWLLQHETFEKSLVFTNTREGAEILGAFLQAEGQRVAVLHGVLDQRERNRIIGLVHSGRVQILVATDLAARGLDVPGMDYVVNFDLPRNGDDYLHRSGRTGRAGAKGRAASLVGPPEWNRMESIARYLNLEVELRAIDGLAAKFSGPKRRKAASKPGSKTAKGSKHPQQQEKPKHKDRLRDRKNIGKRRKPAAAATERAVEAGHTPLRKKQTSTEDSQAPKESRRKDPT
ncbi:DEAD/DEAH box helicase [Thiorhodococcus mannitoliphagus]|uniref:DEAD/DEAH box helicase n=1 Tax=Thiorhodococcus mannitoliphagus TaxID=329406 RepID=A0A6P1DQ73_9GAMM|nr:DEAD/DEAH box helicase [Thiorhodococcus mannitoliphagus]NEX19081.1 DEAD/DEAH box helicase [Thiorhodococcus mannitoliphagus]